MILIGAALAAVAVWIHPGLQHRAKLVGGKLTGEVGLPWSEVVVQAAPWSWQPAVRDWVGPKTDPWTRDLASVEPDPDREGRAVLFEGPTPALRRLNSHFSILPGGTTPHPPHVHVDEELIFPLEGDVEIIRGASESAPDYHVERVVPGQMVYHASNQPHTIRAVGPGPSRYFVLRWEGRGDPREDGPASRTIDLRPGWEALAEMPGPSAKHLVLEEPTALLPKLHVHLSRLDPGGESPEHVDRHDTILYVVEGTIETHGQQIAAPGVNFNPAYVSHSIRHAGDGIARYVAVELHIGE